MAKQQRVEPTLWAKVKRIRRKEMCWRRGDEANRQMWRYLVSSIIIARKQSLYILGDRR